jgi:thiol-disulfide isomerase/thioredoxin
VKRLLIVAFLVLVASLGYRSHGSPTTGTGSLTLPQPAPNPGEKAPLFKAASRDGSTFELSEDGVYVLTFWSTLNKDTADARPELEELARDYGDEGVSFAAVYVSNAINVPEDEEDAPYTVLGDGSGELSSKYNVKRVPRLFLIRNGTIELVQDGHYPENEEQLRAELERVLPEGT